ncbi:MAG TPA: family 43 glycosylhydrolase [Chitinophagaceae bacterium]|jgi:beta-xylosidase|nr:family 43 glycosylhydrolase [Chitinophagaceae bacterium]
MNRLLLLLLLLTPILCPAQQLVLRGDYPDPSVVQVGDTYWASATTSNWGPAYPLLRSRDGLRWTTVGSVFPKLPDWADYYFWAPEITYEKGRYYVYYSAHKKGGNLCIAVASSDRPEGPYRDHGPLMCEPAGSIDAFPMRDDNGKLFLIWKEDLNSIGQATPIWISEMNEERTALIGEKKELFRNDKPWEANLVEGVSMIRRGGYYYAIYAAAGCCGRACTYGTGVARAKNLLGPWEKYSGNPIITNTDQWTCPGHGTPMEKDGRHYFLYHAYDKQTSVYTGRQGLLQEFTFTPDGWIRFLDSVQTQPSEPLVDISESFKGRSLGHQWQWSVFQRPAYALRGGELRLTAGAHPSGTFLGHKTLAGDYTATVRLHRKKSTAFPGIALVGDESNLVTAYLQGDTLKVVRTREGKDSVLQVLLVDAGKKPWLQLQVRNGKDIQFAVGFQKGTLRPVLASPYDGSYLPPWDRALRIGLVARGDSGRVAVFDHFLLEH